MIYRPETERMSHYFHGEPRPAVRRGASTIDDTRAVEPLETNADWERRRGELPETYPFAV